MQLYTIISQVHIQSLSTIFLLAWIALFLVLFFACEHHAAASKKSFTLAVIILVIVTINIIVIPVVLCTHGIFTVDTQDVKYTIKIDDPDLIKLLSDYKIEGYNGDGVFTVIGKEGLN